MDWKSLLKEVAPTVAQFLGGPFAAMGMNLLSEALGVEQDEKKIGEMVASGDPHILLQLRQAEDRARQAMRELDIKEDQLHVDNTRSAREMAEDQGLKAQHRLATVFIGGYFLIFAGFVWALLEGVTIDPAFATLFSALLGIMTMAVKDIINFFYGSSIGSKEKTAAANKQVDQMLAALRAQESARG